MTLYLLDTNAVASLADDPGGPVGKHIARVGVENVATSIIVTGEVEFGLELKGSERLRVQMDRVLSELPVMPFEQPADRHYGLIRAQLKRQGRPIGPNDMLIAAHALALDATLVTANVGEFSRIGDLRIENWLRMQP